MNRSHRRTLLSGAFGLLAILPIVGCSHQAASSAPAASNSSDVAQSAQQAAGAPQPDQELFDSPENAAAVLKDAVRTKDRRLLIQIFGKRLGFLKSLVQGRIDFGERFGKVVDFRFTYGEIIAREANFRAELAVGARARHGDGVQRLVDAELVPVGMPPAILE